VNDYDLEYISPAFVLMSAEMVRLPLTIQEWDSLHQDASENQESSSQQALLSAIFGDEFVLSTVELLLGSHDPLAPELYRPVEGFLRALSPDSARQRLTAICREGSEARFKAARELLVSIADKSLVPTLASFAQANDPEVRRCGVMILNRLVSRGLPDFHSARKIADLFRGSGDQYVEEVLKQVDDEVLKYPEARPSSDPAA
jgi:hypothetical protein